MTISEEKAGSKTWLGRIPPDMLVVAVLILSSTLAFGLGILAGKDMAKPEGKDGFWLETLPKEPAAVIQAVTPETKAAPVPEEPQAQVYMASKNGTKYYLPTCGTAKRIKEENRIWFATKAEAAAAGFTPAANCPGL